MHTERGQKAVIWDWTGTLADEALFDSALCADIEKRMGAPQYFRRLKRLENDWRWFDYVSHFEWAGLDWKKAHLKHKGKLRLVQGAKGILKFCRGLGYQNCLLTNAVKPVIDFRLKMTGCSKYFDLAIGCDEVKAMKEKGFHLRRAMKLLGLKSPKGCMAVGDNPVQDLAPARRLGMRTILCEYGRGMTHYHTSHMLENHDSKFRADYTIKRLADLRKIISRALINPSFYVGQEIPAGISETRVRANGREAGF